MPDDGSVRADALDLAIGGHRLRVFLPDSDGRNLLVDALADVVVDEPAPPAFRVKPPTGKDGFHVLIDRSGFILARTRTSEGCLAVLGSLLANFQLPPEGCIRLPLRAVASEDGVVLAAFPLFTTPPLVERRLERFGYAVIDDLAVNVSANLSVRSHVPSWRAIRALQVPNGHCEPVASRHPITSVLLPRIGSMAPTRAQSIALLAAGEPTLRQQALDIAELLASLVRPVPVDQSASPVEDIYHLLRSLRSS